MYVGEGEREREGHREERKLLLKKESWVTWKLLIKSLNAIVTYKGLGIRINYSKIQGGEKEWERCYNWHRN